MDDKSRAITETAKAVSTGIDAAREFGTCLSKYTGGSVEQLMGIFEDKLKYYRWKKQIEMILEADAILERKGINSPTRRVPLNIAIPLLECGALEDDEELHSLWVNLLANAANSDSSVNMRHSYISILKDLTSFDAIILERIYSLYPGDYSDELWTCELPEFIHDDKPRDDDLTPNPDVVISLSNMQRLGLISSVMVWSRSYECITTTILGGEFYYAVSE